MVGVSKEYAQRDPNNLNVDKFQYLNSLTLDAYKKLKSSIATNGLRNPIQIDEFDNVLDGRHRVQACRELNLSKVDVIVNKGLTDYQKDIFNLDANLDHRKLSLEQKKALMRELRDDGWSIEKLAAAFSLSNLVVSRWVGQVQAEQQTNKLQARLDEQAEMIAQLEALLTKIQHSLATQIGREKLLIEPGDALLHELVRGLTRIQCKFRKHWRLRKKLEIKRVASLLQGSEKFTNAEIAKLAKLEDNSDEYVKKLRSYGRKTSADFNKFLTDAIKNAEQVIKADVPSQEMLDKFEDDLESSLDYAHCVKYIHGDAIGRENASLLRRLHRLYSFDTYKGYDDWLRARCNNLLSILKAIDYRYATVVKSHVDDFFDSALQPWTRVKGNMAVINEIDKAYSTYCKTCGIECPKVMSELLTAWEQNGDTLNCRYIRKTLAPLHLATL